MDKSERTTNAEVSGGKLEFEKLTGVIIGCAIKVQRVLGPGLLEGTYHACLTHELRKAGLKVQTEVYADIQYEELLIEKAYRMDVLVEGSIVLELKTTERLTEVHEAQLFTYLRFSGTPLGILLNFWAWPLKKAGIKRVLNPRSTLRSPPDFLSSPPRL